MLNRTLKESSAVRNRGREMGNRRQRAEIGGRVVKEGLASGSVGVRKLSVSGRTENSLFVQRPAKRPMWWGQDESGDRPHRGGGGPTGVPIQRPQRRCLLHAPECLLSTQPLHTFTTAKGPVTLISLSPVPVDHHHPP